METKRRDTPSIDLSLFGATLSKHLCPHSSLPRPRRAASKTSPKFICDKHPLFFTSDLSCCLPDSLASPTDVKILLDSLPPHSTLLFKKYGQRQGDVGMKLDRDREAAISWAISSNQFVTLQIYTQPLTHLVNDPFQIYYVYNPHSKRFELSQPPDYDPQSMYWSIAKDEPTSSDTIWRQLKNNTTFTRENILRLSSMAHDYDNPYWIEAFNRLVDEDPGLFVYKFDRFADPGPLI